MSGLCGLTPAEPLAHCGIGPGAEPQVFLFVLFCYFIFCTATVDVHDDRGTMADCRTAM
jgi:hypothetical protein